jgi:16S rRNA (adenine1518-N6/adenine1519-N6)-dimethyltransferase
MSVSELKIQDVLRAHGLSAKKSLGQNFLVDDSALEKITAAAGISRTDAVLEIGPGLGSLTRHLAEAAGSVTAVELDERFLPVLAEMLAPWSNVRIVQGDILKLDPAELMGGVGYLVVANIPYYITSAVIRHLLESRYPPQRLVLTVQREVAERICAKPGDMSLLALSVQVYGEPRIAARIPAGAFFPPPKVDSAVVCVDLRAVPQIPPGDLERFFALAKAGFSQKRKMLRNSLAGGLKMESLDVLRRMEVAGIEGTRRAETLSLAEWGHLVKAFSE